MARKAAELSALGVKAIKTPGLHFVGGVSGLALQVLPTGGRSWILRVSVGGRRRDMGLGGFPDVPLADAREAARRARELIREGHDPVARAQTARSALRAGAAKSITFREAAQAYISAQESGWKNSKHRAQWSSSLERYAFPTIGALQVPDVELAHIHQILEPIWTTKTETAVRVRSRIELVLDWAQARGYRTGLNPARWRGHLDKMFPKRTKVAKPVHHRALPAREMFAFMLRLRAADGVGARALEFAILTAARSGEVRGARWSEIDLPERIWKIPGERMKSGREHRAPLSTPAVALLQSLPRFAGEDLVFQSVRRGPLSDMTLSAVLRRMDVPAVPHGFRSTFRDWASEMTSYSAEVAEMALAHAIGSKVEAAYRRGDLLIKRRQLAEDWALFCETPWPVSGNVVSLRGSS